METRLILIEDHHLDWLRPLSVTLPAFEIPLGMWTLRERLALVSGVRERRVLMRPVLESLFQGQDWQVGWAPADEGRQDIWLSSRLGPDQDILEQICRAEASGVPWIWLHADDLVAAALGPSESAALHTSWQAWMGQHGFAADAESQPWRPESGLSGWQVIQRMNEHALWVPSGQAEDGAAPLVSEWEQWVRTENALLPAIWDIVQALPRALVKDAIRCPGLSSARTPFGIMADHENPVWAADHLWERARTLWSGCALLGAEADVLIAGQVTCEPGVVLDTTNGPVLLAHGVRIESGSRLEGPLYVGSGCRIKAGTRLYGGCSFGPGCRVAGEIGETLAMPFVNKQHDGFIGHAVLGSWVNLGAMTTCSDLKNNYGEVRVDLGWGPVPTGRRFVGLMAGDHVKTAIGTLFNTGTVVMPAGNIFGGGMGAKHVPAFTWGETAGGHDLEKFMATAELVMARRGCLCTEGHRRLFRELAGSA